MPNTDARVESGTKPIFFSTPALGRAVRLGELYDQRSGQFLGVQLWSEPEDKENVVETQIKHTDLSLNPSTTLQDKAALLDIDAQRSLHILSGLVKVSGSAAYVKDAKANTHEQAFALALRVRLKEKRILFSEEKLGRNVLPVPREDYIDGELATHFVSSIVYGGDVIVNLVARRAHLTKSEKLEGQLKSQFDDLKGAINLEGQVDFDVKDRFSNLDNKFDLYTYGDVPLNQVPTNPKDLLDIIPKAASFINDHKGVPISVTLQPVPEELKLKEGNKVYEIDRLFTDQVLNAYAQLDDLANRFSVLADSTEHLAEFVPELARVARAAAGRYAEEHGVLRHQLRNFLHDYQHGHVRLESDGIFKASKTKGGLYDIPVLAVARRLHQRYLEPDDGVEGKENGEPLSRYYPSTLAGLEHELLKFQRFVSDLQRSRDTIRSLEDSSKESVCLSNIDDICRAVSLQSSLPLFIMTPFTPKTTKLKPDLAIIQFLAILRENAAYFNDPDAPAHILYAEDLKDLESRLPNDNKFSQLERPCLFFGQVDPKGNLSWCHTSSTTSRASSTILSTSSTKDFSLKLHHKSSEKSGEVSCRIDAINVARSFSFEIRAKRTASGRQTAGWAICNLRYAESKQKYLSFEVPLRVIIRRDPDELIPASVDSCDAPPTDKPFVATFVQDVEARKWTLYLDDKAVGTETIPPVRKHGQQSTSVELYYPSDIFWWKGEVYEVRAFPYALTEEQVSAEVKKAGDTTI